MTLALKNNGPRMGMSPSTGIWIGSKKKEEAWKWVKYLGSADCQSVVASYGVVFPAINGMAEKAVEAQKKKGIDSSAFLAMSKEQTFLTPIGDNASQIDEIMRTSIESVLLGKQPFTGTTPYTWPVTAADAPRVGKSACEGAVYPLGYGLDATGKLLGPPAC